MFPNFSMYFARHLPSSDMTRTLTTSQYLSRPLLMHHHPNYPSSPVRGCHHALGARISFLKTPSKKFVKEWWRWWCKVTDDNEYDDRVMMNDNDDDDGDGIAGGEDDGDSAMRILRVMVRYSVVTAVIMLMRAVRMRWWWCRDYRLLVEGFFRV